jgi:hypothetical protein
MATAMINFLRGMAEIRQHPSCCALVDVDITDKQYVCLARGSDAAPVHVAPGMGVEASWLMSSCAMSAGSRPQRSRVARWFQPQQCRILAQIRRERGERPGGIEEQDRFAQSGLGGQ